MTLQVLDFMSPGLKRKMAGHLHGSWMGNITFFITGTERDEAFVTAVALQMTTRACPREELLIRTGENASCLYIVRRGLVGCHGKVFRKGKWLGEDMIIGAKMKRQVVDGCRVTFWSQHAHRSCAESGAPHETLLDCECRTPGSSWVVRGIRQPRLSDDRYGGFCLCLVF